MPNVLSPRDLVFRPDNMDETVPHASGSGVRLYDCPRPKAIHFSELGPELFRLLLGPPWLK